MKITWRSGKMRSLCRSSKTMKLYGTRQKIIPFYGWCLDRSIWFYQRWKTCCKIAPINPIVSSLRHVECHTPGLPQQRAWHHRSLGQKKRSAEDFVRWHATQLVEFGYISKFPNLRGPPAFQGKLVFYPPGNWHIATLGKGKSSSKAPFGWDMLVPFPKGFKSLIFESVWCLDQTLLPLILSSLTEKRTQCLQPILLGRTNERSAKSERSSCNCKGVQEISPKCEKICSNSKLSTHSRPLQSTQKGPETFMDTFDHSPSTRHVETNPPVAAHVPRSRLLHLILGLSPLPATGTNEGF